MLQSVFLWVWMVVPIHKNLPVAGDYISFPNRRLPSLNSTLRTWSKSSSNVEYIVVLMSCCSFTLVSSIVTEKCKVVTGFDYSAWQVYISCFYTKVFLLCLMWENRTFVFLYFFWMVSSWTPPRCTIGFWVLTFSSVESINPFKA